MAGEEDLLREVGLSKDELNDLLQKLDRFVGTLTVRQQQALRIERHEGKEATEVLQKEVKAGQLEAFIKTRTQSGVVVTLRKTGS